jgi:hypothetical protein
LFDDFVSLFQSKLAGHAQIAAGRLCISKVNQGQGPVKIGFRKFFFIVNSLVIILDSSCIVFQANLDISPVKIGKSIFGLKPYRRIIVLNSALVIGRKRNILRDLLFGAIP